MNNPLYYLSWQKKSWAFLLVLMLVCSFSAQAQHNAEVQIKTVFNQLVTAYGSAKTAPELTFMKANPKPETPAFYTNKTIKVDLQFYKLCQTFGKDSLNALSIVISHELAHYYYEHDFCSDFAYAIRNKSVPFSSGLKLINKNQKLIYETQADDKGLFYAAIAGYHPFEIQPKLLDAIYQFYQLREVNIGYPSKAERKEIAHNAQMKAAQLYTVFQQGITNKENKKYTKALAAFEEVNTYFPSRENYNNIGVVKTLQALDLKVLTSEEYEHPKRFLYPLETENKSRLNKGQTRSLDNTSEEMEKLLKEAQKDFQDAIRLDPNFTKGYINLACVLDLLDDPIGAISILTKQLLPKEEREKIDAQRILAIAYFHSNVKEYETKAKEIWKELEK